MYDLLRKKFLLKTGLLRFSVGFSLTEMMIVVVIVGILATIAIPTYNKMVENARVSEAKAMIAAIVSAEKAYKQRNGAFLTIAENGADFNDKLRIDLGDSPYFDYAVTSTDPYKQIHFKVTATVNARGKSQGGLPDGTVDYDYDMTNDPNPRGTWGGSLN